MFVSSRSVTMKAFYFLALLASFACASAEQPQVETPQGKLMGVHMETVSHRKISAFLGIPYAKPPVGKLRFREPQHPEPWLGTLNASQAGPHCLQYSHYSPPLIQGIEDCLYLSVFVPEEPSKHKSKLDIVVNIHGGAFMFFSSSYYGPEYLLDRDVILVNVNYRLGILGFMSMGDLTLPGNNGLKDQLMALKWVQKNIKYFGGDPKKVTVVGLSAGGASTHYHTISPKSNGHLSRAIIISGSTLCHWAQMENAKEKSIIIAKQMGCPVDTTKEMVECLQNRNGEHIVKLTQLFMFWKYNPFSPFAPVVEPSHPGAFIDRHPSEYIKNKLANDIPVIFSLAQDEGLYPGAEFLANNNKLQYISDNWKQAFPHILDFNFTVPLSEQSSVSEKIYNQYFGKGHIKDDGKTLIQLLSDRMFNIPVAQAAKLHATYLKSPVHTMLFTRVGDSGLQDLFGLHRDVYAGAAHGDDLPHVLRASYNVLDNDKIAMKMSKRMIDLWMDFINGKEFPQKWKPLQDSLPSYSYMVIGTHDTSDDKFITVKDYANEKFWRSLGMKEDNGFDKVTREEL